MSGSIKAGNFRICPFCGSRNKAAHKYCVRCSESLDAAPRGPVPAARQGGQAGTRMSRFLIAAAAVVAIGVGFMAHTLLRATSEVSALSEDVRADSARTVRAAPPPVSGWYPGANVPVEPDTAPAWSSGSFPVARPNPYDVPGDPSASMVGIAPSPSHVRAAMARKRVFTDDDLLATRGGAWSTPPASADVAEREAKLGIAESRVRTARARLQNARSQRTPGVDGDHLREAIAQAADDLEDAEEDVARARRKLAEERRDN